MRSWPAAIAASALFLASAGPAASAGTPRRVMSLNLCTDQLVLQLLPRERIASVTYLSRSPEEPFLSAEALGVPINFGTAEEVLRQNPDLVIAGAGSTPAVRALLRRVGVRLLEVPAAENFDEIRKAVRMVARAVGEEGVGEALIARMDRTLAELAATAPEHPFRVAGWDRTGNVPAQGTLFDAILTAAGGINIGAALRTPILHGRYTGFDLEQLLALRPDLIAVGQSPIGRSGRANEMLQHRVVRRLYANRQITYPEAFYSCGLPQSADAARDLRRAMLEATKAKERP